MRNTIVHFLAVLSLAGSVFAGPIDALNRVLDSFDKWELSTLDTDYVTLPSEWWRLGVQGIWSNTNINLREYTVLYGMQGNLDSDTKMKFGLQGAFRGWGVSYTWDVDSRDWNLGLSYFGNAFGIEFVNSRTKSLCGDIDAYVWKITEEYGFLPNQDEINVSRKDVRHHNILVDGYYAFDSEHFSFPAAMDQSHLQKKSAGSFLLGASYVFSEFAFRERSDIYEMSELERTTISEVALGAGYGHNFVYKMLENSQFLIHFSAIPMVSVWNRYKMKSPEISLMALFDEEESHGHYWIWDDFKNDQLQFVWFLRTSFTYTYKKLYMGLKAEVVRQTLSKGDDLDLEADLLNIRGFAGVRF